MSGPLMFFGIGVALEASGLFLAVIGFRETWRDFAEDERFFEPVHQWAGRIRAAGANVAAGLSGRRDVVVRAGAAAAIGVAGSVTARMRPGPLTPATDLATFAAAVEERVKDIYERLGALRDEAAAETTARAKADRELAERLAAEVARLKGVSQRIAVGGLRQQFVGWLLIAFGFILQAVATFMQAWRT
ncbi:MAG TPA: hypothetical protein VGS60_07300 [Actinomycetes bacterium]|nr:hypothetical protein [Actinomycetes bacterium]